MHVSDRSPEARARQWPTAVTGAVLAAGLAATLVLASGGDHTGIGRPGGNHPGSVASLLADRSQRGNRPPTERLVERLLADVRLPHGAHRRSTAPVHELRGPGSTVASSHLVERHHWWTERQSVHDVLAYIRHHAPKGCRFDGSGTSSGPGERTVHEILCAGSSTHYAFGPGVDVEAVRTSGGSAVRAEADAVWLPRRPAYSYVRHPSAARVVVERHPSYPGARRLPTVRRTLGERKATRLAVVLDRQTVSPPVAFACPADFPGVEDRLVLSTSRGPVRVTVGLTGCGGIEVRVPGHHAVQLSGAGTLDSAVRHQLHLPRRYRY